MTRVMLVCPEPLGHGQPAGIGIRFVEIARVLRDDGHDITILSPDAGKVEGTRADHVSEERFATLSGEHDVAVVQGHVANAFFVHAKPIPTVVDLYDPYIIENLHYYTERGAEVFQHDHFTLMTSLVRGDYFLCASEAQRLFYLGAMLATGRLNPALFEDDPRLDSLIAIAPFGVQPPRDIQPRTSHDILFGGIYDWYDPIAAIDAVATARNEIADLTLTFTRHPNPDITPQGKLAEAIAYARKKSYAFVRFEPWAPYEQRAAFFERFSLALLTFPRSIETDLSMRTRVYDYLRSGLPIITSSAPGTDELLARYDAGIVTEDFARAIVGLLRDRTRYEAMVRGSQQFVREHQWDRTLAPLREFCRTPRFERTKETFTSQPSLPERPPSILDRLKRRLRA
ncbi:MAG: glycosyltransferase family 4 protein [Acidobacteriota bacterium]|nr:glycosyltransferase family 4 protein [Acidobacteriota bacterium]